MENHAILNLVGSERLSEKVTLTNLIECFAHRFLSFLPHFGGFVCFLTTGLGHISTKLHEPIVLMGISGHHLPVTGSPPLNTYFLGPWCERRFFLNVKGTFRKRKGGYSHRHQNM